MYSTIVVPLDLTVEAERAVSYGAALARQASAELDLLTVQPSHVSSASIREHLAEIAGRHGVEARLRVLAADDVASAIVEATDGPDTLLCLQTHARRAISELVLGSISEQVVRECRRPVLLVGPRCGPAPDQFTAMVVGLDGSELAEQILPVVAEWSSQLGVTPWLFEVLPARVPLELGSEDVHESAYVHNRAEELAQQAVKAEWDTAHDRDPADAIARFADAQQASLIALTTHGRSGLRRLALGSVALQVAHQATVPVLILRPEAR